MEANALLSRQGERSIKVELKVSTCVLLQPLHTEVLFLFLGTARCCCLGVRARASFESHLHFARGGRVLYLLSFESHLPFCSGR